MVRFREQVLSTCWLITTLSIFSCGMVALSYLRAAFPSEPFTSPSHASAKCNPEAMQKTIEIWIIWMTTLFISSVSILWYVRKIVETVAVVETKGNAFEEEAFKAAQDELRQAIKAVNDSLDTLTAQAEPNSASLDEYVKSIGERNMAMAKVARTKPKEGLATWPIGRQRQVRLFFLMAVVFSFTAGVCAAVVLYLTMQLQVGCHDGAVAISPFVVIGLIHLSLHVQMAWVGFTED